MVYSGTRLFNPHLIGSPAGILKIAELLFGGGAWGPLTLAAWDRGSVLALSLGPHLFYFWVTAGSWALVLLTFVLQLFMSTEVPDTEEEKKAANAPQLGDLAMNLIIGLLYLLAIIALGLYSFGPFSNAEASGIDALVVAASRSRADFMIIMAAFAFLTHAIHSLTIFHYLKVGAKRWEQERRWFWQSSVQRAPNNQQGPQQEPIYANPAVLPPSEPVLTGLPNPGTAQGNYYKDANNTRRERRDSVP